MVVVARHKARVAEVTVTVQAAMAGVMIGVMIVRRVVVVAQQENLAMVIAVKPDQPVAAVLKVAVARTVKVALKGAIITLVQPAAASHHSVTNEPAAANQHLVTNQPAAASHLVASQPLTNVRILVPNRRHQSHHPIAAVTARNARHLSRKSALARRGQAAMPPRRAARAH